MEAADRGYGFDQHHSAPDSSEIKKNRLLVPRLVLPANNGDAGVDKPNSSSTTSASTYARQIRPANTALNRPSTAKKRPSTASSSSSNNNKGNNSANGVVVLKDSMSMRGSVNTRYSGNTDDEFGDNDSFILEDNNRIDDDDDFINESLEAAHKARLSRQKAHQQQQKAAQKPSSSRSTSLSRTSSISTNMSTATRSPGLTASMKPLSARSRIQKVYGIDMTTPRTAEYAIQHRIVKTSSTSSVNSISISTEPQQHQEQQQQQHQPLTVPPSAATKKKETQPQPQQQQQQAQVVPQQQHKPASASAARPRSSGPTTFIYKNGKVNPYLQPQRLVHKSRSRPATSKSSNSSNSNNKANNHASSKQIRPHRPHSARFEAAEELNDNDFIAEDNDTEYHPIDDIRAEVSHNYNNNNDSDIMSITDEDMPPSQRLEVLEQQIASLQQHQQQRRRRPDQESRIVALQVEKIALTKLLHGEFSVPSVQAVLELSRTYLELGAYDPCLMHAEKALKMNQNVALALSTASSSSSNNNRLKVPTRPSSSGKATRVPTPKRVNGDDAASRQQQELERVRLLRVSQELTPTILSTIAMAQYQQRDYTAALATLKHALKLNSEITSLSPSDDSTDAGTDETVDTGRSSSSSTRGTGSNGSSSSSSSRFSILMGLGKVSAAAGQYDQAVDYLEQAWEVKEAEDSRSTDLASVYSELGRVKALMGQFENAVEMYNQAMRIMEADAKTNQTTYNRKSIGNLCCILVDLYSKLEDYESALPLARKSFEILNVSDEDIEEFLDRHRGHDDQTPDEEIRRQRQRQHLRQQHEDASPVTELSQLQQAISVQITLGFVMVKCSEFTEACSVLERAMDLIERWDSNNEDSSPVLVAPLQKAHTYKMLGTVYLALKKGEEALRAYKKAVSIYGKHLGGGGGSSADKPNSVSSNSVFYETVGPLIDRITDLEKYLKHKEWQASSGLDASSGLTARLFGTRIDEEGESHNEGTEDESKISDNCDEEEDSSNNDNDNNGEEDEEEEDNSSYASLIIKDSPRGSSYGDDPAGDDEA